VYSSSVDLTESTANPLNGDEQQHYQAAILANILDVLITTDLHFHIRTWNKVAETVYGISESEAIGKDLNAIMRPDFLLSSSEEALRQLQLTGSWKGEVACTDQGGTIQYFLNTLTYLFDKSGEKTGVLLIGKNITERRQAQEVLRESETFYRGLIIGSLDGIVLTNTAGIINFASDAVTTILGFTKEEIIGKSAFDFIHPEDLPVTLDAFEKEIRQESEIKYLVVRLLCQSGNWVWCMLRAHSLLENKHVNGIAIYFHDDTRRKTATDALIESEQRFRNLVRDLRIGILMQDMEGNILLSNNAMNRMMGTTEADLLGKKIWEIYSEAVNEAGKPLSKEERPIYRAMHSKRLVRDQVMGVRHPVTGQRIWMLLNADPIMNNDGQVISIICSFMDITERKKLEDRLLTDKLNHQRQLTQATIDSQEQERMEIGKELHDNIGQQLTTIKLYLDLARSTADDATNEMIALAVRNVSDVINEIRGLCHTLIPPSLGDLGLVESINDLVNLLTRSRKVEAKLFAAFFKEDKVPENQKLMLFRIVQEQLNNIVKHAEASMAIVHLQNDSGELVLEITDDGQGFDIGKIKRGLGLTNIKNRAETLGGEVEFISAPGEGCTIRVVVPLSAERE
jgi:PAS domain S-box-containing protein